MGTPNKSSVLEIPNVTPRFADRVGQMENRRRMYAAELVLIMVTCDG